MSTGAEPELVQRWIDTWTYARSLDSSLVDGWPLVQVRSATRETELICIDPGPEAFIDLLPHVDGDPRAMLTVIATDVRPYRSLDLPPGVRLDRDDETLMATTFTSLHVSPLDPGLSSRWDVTGHQTTYSVESGERVAAEGKIGILGTDATFDAVETMPDFRRRGLGRHVMAVLTAYALESGAVTGVLAATAPGRLLYESLGWEPVFQMWSLMGVATEL